MKRTVHVAFAIGAIGAVLVGLPAMAKPYIDDSGVHSAIKGDISGGGWSAKCQDSGQEAAIDPIVNYGGTAMHIHEFFAPLVVTSTTRPTDLLSVAKAAIVCNGPTLPISTPVGGCTHASTQVCDKSAYWVPELVHDTDPANSSATATPIGPSFVNVYFRNEYVDPASIVPITSDFVAVAGSATTHTPQDPWIVNWQCVDSNAALHGGQKYEWGGRYQNTIPSTCQLPLPASSGDDQYLRLVVTFPECVKMGPGPTAGMETPSAFEYEHSGSPTPPNPTGPGGSYINCPAGAGWSSIPTIQLGFHWQLNSSANSAFFPTSYSGGQVIYSLSDTWLSSDLMALQMGGATLPPFLPGTTAHADFENGYTAADISALVTQCVNASVNCGFINGE